MIIDRMFRSSSSKLIHLTNQFYFSTAGTGAKKGSKPPTLTLCQANNHPNYRLKQAKARLVAKATGKSKQTKPAQKQLFTTPKKERAPTVVKYHKIVQEHGISVQLNENSVRSNDGTSSGAVIADRLRMARRKALEKMASTSAETGQAGISIAEQVNKYVQHKSVREHGLNIVAYENPVRSSDGTSSGALAADRLRMARRKALENMSKPLLESTGAPHDIASAHATMKHIQRKQVQEYGLNILAYENPVRSSDGTSSGALAADRLRMARRKALENMSKPVSDSIEEVCDTAARRSTEKQTRHESVREHGFNFVAYENPYENPVRSSDGTSSGALAADRLRMARRKALASMATPAPGSNGTK